MSQPSRLPEFREIVVPSSLDGSPEPSLLYLPEGEPKALLVGLHTWSADRFNQQATYLPYCRERGWALLLPEFRGPNLDTNPRATEAGGSALARRDIVDATRQVLEDHFGHLGHLRQAPVFLLGGSGGGHMSLQVAAREDFRWSAVSSWCPITDLAAWHSENAGYAPHIAAVCGGTPEEQPGEYRERSPLCVASALRNVRLQLGHGRHDRSVPYTHSVRLIEQLHDAPEFYYSIFDGAHELLAPLAFAFFDRSLAAGQASELTG